MTNNEVKNALYCARQHAEETICEECDLYNICDHSTTKDIARIWIKSLEEIDKLRAEIERLKIERELNMRVNMCSAKDQPPFGLS